MCRGIVLLVAALASLNSAHGICQQRIPPPGPCQCFFLGFAADASRVRCPPHFAGQHLPPVQRRIPPQEAAWIRATNPPQARKWAKEDMHEKRYKVGL